MHKKVIGYVCGILAATCYGLNPLFALPLINDGLDVLSILLWRYVLTIPLMIVLMLVQQVSFHITRKASLQLLFLGTMMVLSSVCLYEAYKYMDAGLASTILFLYPILTAIIMSGVFHERLALIVWGCLCVAMIGVGVLCEFDGAVKISLWGIILVLLSTITYAIYLVFINKGSLMHLPSTTITFYVLLVGAIVLIGIAGSTGHISTPQGLHWGYSIGAAFFPTVLSLILTTIAIQHIGSTRTAILGAMEPLTALIVGVWLFNEHLTIRSIIGILLILLSVTVVVIHKDK